MDVTTLFQQRLNAIPLLEDGKLIQYTRSNGDTSFSFLFLLPKPVDLGCEELLNFHTVTMMLKSSTLKGPFDWTGGKESVAEQIHLA